MSQQIFPFGGFAAGAGSFHSASFTGFVALSPVTPKALIKSLPLKPQTPEEIYKGSV